MKNKFFKAFALALLVSISILGCKKNEVRPNPTISLSTNSGLVHSDTTAVAGSSVQIGLVCKWNGTDIMKYITIYLNNQYINSYTMPDSMQQEGLMKFEVYKTNQDQDNWVFEITDAKGQKGYAAINIFRDKTGGAISTYQGITLGAQNNTDYGNFYSISKNLVYTLSDAKSNQNIIDFVIGYDDLNGLYMASPGSSLAFDYDLSTWTTKNTAFFCVSDKTSTQFDYIDSDILLMNEFNAAQQTDKAKNLAKGSVYSFKSSTNKYGLIRINALSSIITGGANFDIKIQQ